MSRLIIDGIEVEVVRSLCAKYLRLSVYRDGRVRLALPRRASEQDAERFIQTRTAWIKGARARVLNAVAVPMPSLPASDLPRLREQARQLVQILLQRYQEVYKFTYSSVRIKRMSTRWGSCSKRGNLNFNIHIIHLPPHLQEYLVVHEVCHLREMNHSSRFWALVERTIPDYAARRHELRSGYRLR